MARSDQGIATGEDRVVRAAGGLVHRSGPEGLEVALVHRPRYDDWTFPKGKLVEGESDEQGALREVEEETGLRCQLGRFLGTRRYTDRHGRPKVVRYWSMTPLGGDFQPTPEVDRIEWLPVARVARQLTYRRDRALLRRLLEAVDHSTNL
jgi:8-oxo-dGTP diphosphatase